METNNEFEQVRSTRKFFIKSKTSYRFFLGG